jgi:hypothetical protein
VHGVITIHFDMIEGRSTTKDGYRYQTGEGVVVNQEARNSFRQRKGHPRFSGDFSGPQTSADTKPGVPRGPGNPVPDTPDQNPVRA